MGEHGTTFGTFLTRCFGLGYYILVVQTAHRQIGAFLSDAPVVRPGYYGRLSTFIFDCRQFAPYKATAANDKIMAVTTTDISIGGPEPAILLMDEFKTLISHHCETFDSPPFTLNAGGDPIYAVEAFRLVM
jgi:hypothetical protein